MEWTGVALRESQGNDGWKTLHQRRFALSENPQEDEGQGSSEDHSETHILACFNSRESDDSLVIGQVLTRLQGVPRMADDFDLISDPGRALHIAAGKGSHQR